MMLVGLQEHLKLLTILQRIEKYEKTGFLIITYREQSIKLSVWQGLIMSIEPLHGHGTLWNRLLQAGAISLYDLQVALDDAGIPYNQFISTVNCNEMEMVLILKRLRLVSHEQLYKWVRQEAIGIIQFLLTWSEAEISFEEGVQPSKDRFPIALPISSLLPSLPISNASNKDFTPLVEKSFTPLTPFPTTFKSSKLNQEEKGVPIASLRITPIPIDFNTTMQNQKTAIPTNSPSVTFLSLHDFVTSPTSQPYGNVVVQPKKEEVTYSPDLSAIETLIHRSILPSAITNLIHPSPDDSFPMGDLSSRQSQNSIIPFSAFLVTAIVLIAVLALGASKLVVSPQISTNSAKSAGPELGSSPQELGSSKLVLSYQTYVDGTKIGDSKKEVVISTNKPTLFGYALSNVKVTLTLQSSSLRKITKTDILRRETTTDSNGYWIYYFNDETLPPQSLPPGIYKVYLTLTDANGSSSSTLLTATFNVPTVLPTNPTTIIVPAPSLRELNYFTVSLLMFGVLGILVLVYSIIKHQKVKE